MTNISAIILYMLGYASLSMKRECKNIATLRKLSKVAKQRNERMCYLIYRPIPLVQVHGNRTQNLSSGKPRANQSVGGASGDYGIGILFRSVDLPSMLEYTRPSTHPTWSSNGPSPWQQTTDQSAIRLTKPRLIGTGRWRYMRFICGWDTYLVVWMVLGC